jgi:hypothetical protein
MAAASGSLVYLPNTKGGTIMNFFKHLVMLVLAAGVLLAVEYKVTSAKAHAAGQAAGLRITPVSDAAITAPVKNTQGRVTSIVGPVLALEADGREMAFTVDENTGVLARGASQATRSAGGGRLRITDFVQKGDIVRVMYRELNGWMRAVEIQIRGRNTIAAR